jgi:hypothetical protein
MRVGGSTLLDEKGNDNILEELKIQLILNFTRNYLPDWKGQKKNGRNTKTECPKGKNGCVSPLSMNVWILLFDLPLATVLHKR